MIFSFAMLLAGAMLDAPPHYAIDAQLRPDSGTLSARVTVTLPGVAGNARRFLLGSTYAVNELTATNADVTIAPTDKPFPNLQAIVVTPRTSDEVTLRVSYGGKLSAFVSPPMNVISGDLVELSIDSFCIPYQAELGALMTVEARIDGIAAGAQVVTNQRFERTSSGLRIARTDPTGDLVLVASPALKELREGRFTFYAADMAAGSAIIYREHGRGALEFLESILGTLPVDQASIIVVKRESGSGYARPGYIIVTERPSSQPVEGIAKFIAHELSHTWFSRADLLGEDYWLVETPAEYIGLRYVQKVLGDPAMERLLIPKRAQAATAGPILGTGRASSAPLYAKGPLLLFDLEKQIGREKVDQVLGSLARAKVQTTAGFLASLRQVAGDSLTRAFESRLRAHGWKEGGS